MSKFGRRFAAVLIVLIVLGITIYAAALIIAVPSSSTINVSVNSNGGFLQNVTVSCYGCVPNNKYDWEGTMSIAGGTPIPMIDSTPNSTEIKLTLAEGIPITPNSPCHSEYQTNSTCLYPLYSLPFSVHFSIQKTSKGGILKAIFYLTNGNWFPFQTTSGNLTKTFNFESD